MTLPAGFALVDAAMTPQPLYLVDKAGFAGWRAAQAPAVQAWLAAQRFDGSAGTAQSWADAEGAIGGAVIGIGDALDPHSYAHAPLALPGGDWQVVADIDEAKAHLDAEGVRQDGDIQHIPGLVKLITFYDPDGNAFMFSRSEAAG